MFSFLSGLLLKGTEPFFAPLCLPSGVSNRVQSQGQFSLQQLTTHTINTAEVHSHTNDYYYSDGPKLHVH